MASFCKQCSEEFFGADSKDFAHLVDSPGWADVFCDGCGYIYVDHTGKKVAEQPEWPWED